MSEMDQATIDGAVDDIDVGAVDAGEMPANDAETETEGAEQSEASAQQKAEQESRERDAKRKSAVEQRFAKMTWEKNEALRELQELRQKYASQEQQHLQEPSLYDFDSIDDYSKAMAEFQEKKAEQNFQGRFEQQQAEQQRHAQTLKLESAETAFHKQHADYYNVVGNLVGLSGGQLPEQLSAAIFELGQEAPAILYEIGKDPVECIELLNMPPNLQWMKLGEVRASLKNTTTPPKVPNAPAPVSPVTGKANVKKNPLEMGDGDAVNYLKSLRKKGK